MGTEHRSGRPGSYYAVLGVRPDAPATEIRSAYRKLAMKWHPDRRRGREPWLVEEANKRFQQIQEAYQVLSDGKRRTLHDAGLYDPVQDDEEEVEGFHDFVQEMLTLMANVRREVILFIFNFVYVYFFLFFWYSKYFGSAGEVLEDGLVTSDLTVFVGRQIRFRKEFFYI
ncbi:uncharacterized protein [Elaeis guineensis]|uniref:DnaJ homolog subfamily B member 3 isoform X2 n=1 Tax=Elaeis guineensis var. tenera TaxID=51953 RepID=A0A6J0PFK8_ELAGV|nr:dnaJ homolog subfamily B member 3 isoform X2 [Elaeis guineensis]